MTETNRSRVVVCVLLAIVVFHIIVAWQDFSTLARNGYLYDDSFYAFQIARNMANGIGMTFDGVHPTTGFQPLYVFLLVPVFMIAGSDPVLSVHIALSLLAVFTGLTAYVLYKLARRYVGFSASLIAAAIWAFSPIVIKQTANGLETAVASFMIAVSVWYYLARVRGEKYPHISRFLVLGLLLGLSIVSRIDGGFLVLIMLLDYLIVLKSREEAARIMARAAHIIIGIILLYGPWVVFNMLETGNILQDSGSATRFLSLAYASYFDYGPKSLASQGPDLSFIWIHVEHAISSLKVVPPVQIFFRLTEKIDEGLGTGTTFKTAGNIAGFILMLAAGYLIAGWRKDSNRSRRGEIYFLLVYSGVLMLSYALYVFGAFFFLRYFYPVYLIASIYFALLLQDGIDWIKRRTTALRKAAVTAAAFYLILFSSFSYSQAFRSHAIYPYYDIAAWIEENTDTEDKIGIFQCGTIGYLCDRQIVNLDGKVNRMALCALKADALCEYLKEEGIDVVIDHSEVIELFLGVNPPAMMDKCTKISLGSSYPHCDWYAIDCSVFRAERLTDAGVSPDSSIYSRTFQEEK